MNIGFFDSGLGGLTILRAVAKALPEYDYAFFGDTANLPYGDKTEEEVYELTKAGVEHLFLKDSVLVIIACNTASAQTLRKLQDEWLPVAYPDRKILGVIVPTVEEVVGLGKQSVALIATRRTVNSEKYLHELTKHDAAAISFVQIATPELVPLIELGEIDTAATQAIARIEAEAGESEVVVLGCTHYTQVKEQLRTHFGVQKIILSQDEIIPEKLQLYLSAHPEILAQLTTGGRRDIHLSKHRPDYDQLMSQFLGGVLLAEE